MHKNKNINFKYRNLPPPSHMEQFCRALHPDLDLSPTCLSWFRQATEHCTGLLIRSRDPSSRFWATVKNFIFPERHTSLISQKIPISIHPNRLSIQDCHSLFLDIVHDYIQRAPRYSTEAATNVLLWQVLYSLMGIMALGSLLVTLIFAYRKFGWSLKKEDPLQILFAPERRAKAYVNHNVRVMKYELQRLHVRHLVQPEELFPPDGTTTLVMKMSSKMTFLDGVVSSNATCTGRLYRIYEMMGKKKPEYKTETLPKVMRFVNSYTRKLRVLFLFEEDPVYEELLRQRRQKMLAKGMISKASPHKLSSPKSSPKLSPPKLSPPKLSPPKISPPKLSPSRLSPPKFMSASSMTTTMPPPSSTMSGSLTTHAKNFSGIPMRNTSPPPVPPRSVSPLSKQKASPQPLPPLSPRLPTQIPRTITRRHSGLNLKRLAKREGGSGDP